MYDTAQPYLSSYVIFRKDGKIAFLLRKNTKWMDGKYSLPAGKVEKGEPFTAAAIREAQEEVGAIIAPDNLRQRTVAYRHGEDGTDWVDVLFEAEHWAGELTNAEPDVHGELAWFEPSNLPDTVIPAVAEYIRAVEVGETYIEYGWE